MLGMQLDPAELMEGEHVVLDKAANSIIKLSDYGLKRLPYDHLQNLIGFKGKEAVGGQLHLTNFRLVFKSHPVNRVQGKFSIFLPSVTGLRNTSPNFLMKRLEVQTELQIFEFVVWGVDEFIRATNSQQQALTREQTIALAKAVRKTPAKFLTDTQVSQFVNHIAMNMHELAAKAAEIAANPLELSAFINVLEIVKILVEKEEEEEPAAPAPAPKKRSAHGK